MESSSNPYQQARGDAKPVVFNDPLSGGSPMPTVQPGEAASRAVARQRRREIKRRRTLETVAIFSQLPDEAEVTTLAVIRIADISAATYWRRVRAGALPKPHNGRTRVGDLRAALAAGAAAPFDSGRTHEATKRSLEVRRLRREAAEREHQAPGVQALAGAAS